MDTLKFEMFKAGTWRRQFQYRSFLPQLVNQPWTWEDLVIHTLLEKATRALGELNAFSLIVPDVDLFIHMHVVKEAQTSSRIEGTQTAIGEVLLPEEQIPPEKRDDWREVRNYVDAVNTAVGELVTLPLSNRLLKQTHAILMRGVHGEHKQPGEFRSSQNWIGGSNLSDAAFIPPYPDEVPDLMSDLEKFWHNEDVSVPDLVRVALSHYQFETIHPFLDGNGRIGRLMITLYLVSKGLLAKPSLYLSDFFERNRASYYDALMAVRLSNDLIHWVRFFLSGVAEIANKGCQTFRQILALKLETDGKILNFGRNAPSAGQAMNILYRRPAISPSDLAREMEITHQTASSLLRKFQRLGILNEVTGGARHKFYVFERYLNLFLM